MRFKLDENFSPKFVAVFNAYGHQTTTVLEEGLCAATDAALFEICQSEKRCLVTMDKDFSNIINFPPLTSHGIVFFRLPSKLAISDIREMVEMFLSTLKERSLEGKLWIVEKNRIREYQNQQ